MNSNLGGRRGELRLSTDHSGLKTLQCRAAATPSLSPDGPAVASALVRDKLVARRHLGGGMKDKGRNQGRNGRHQSGATLSYVPRREGGARLGPRGAPPGRNVPRLHDVDGPPPQFRQANPPNVMMKFHRHSYFQFGPGIQKGE